MYYGGVGARDTPDDILQAMTGLGRFMAKAGHTLRSGGAKGADTAFESGCTSQDGAKEIYLPYMRFNKNESPLFGVCPNAKRIARQFHPNWRALSDVGWLFMSRNVYQVLGKDLKTPSEFMICWTKNGKTIGGTAQSIRLADHYRIPVINLGSISLSEAEDQIMEILNNA